MGWSNVRRNTAICLMGGLIVLAISSLVETQGPPVESDQLRIGSVSAQFEEAQTNPIVDNSPVFSAIFRHSNASAVATKYKLHVATDAEFHDDVWTTAWTTMPATVVGQRCADIGFGGTSLVPDTKYFWRIRFKPEQGQTGAWSEPATFLTLPVLRVGYSLTALDTLTGESPELIVAVEASEESVLAEFAVRVSVGLVLGATFQSAEKYFLANREVDTWTLAVTPTADSVTVKAVGLENEAYEGLESLGVRGEIAVLSFAAAPAGFYDIALQDGVVTLANGLEREVEISYRGDVLEVGTPRIKTAALPDCHAGKGYYHELAYANMEHPVSFEVIAGSLPDSFGFSGNILMSRPNVSSQQGEYEFTVQATGANGATAEADLTLTVVPTGPQLVHAVLIGDQDANGAVSAGDVLELSFDEDIHAGVQALAAIQLSAPGDSLGSGATFVLEEPSISGASSTMLVTLGAGATLTMPASSSPENVILSLADVPNGITDGDGTPPDAGTAAQVRTFVSLVITESYWVVGQNIEPVALSPFTAIPTGISLGNLPDGVFVQDGVLQGAPTLASLGEREGDIYFIREVLADGDERDIVSMLVYETDPRVDFGPVIDVESRLPATHTFARRGDVVEFALTGATEGGGDIVATLGSVILDHAPGSDYTLLRVIIPEDTSFDTLELIVSQGVEVSAVVLVSIEEGEEEDESYIVHVDYFEAVLRCFIWIWLGRAVG